MASGAVDLYLVYQFLKRLTTPFDEWPAYEHGIIDDQGNILRKRKTLTNKVEMDSFRIFDILVLRLKKLLEKVPGGKSRLASYAAALYLIKEYREDMSEDDVLTEDLDSKFSLYLQAVEEEAPTNSAGSGNIAGIGVGPAGEPGFTPAQMRRYKRRNRKNAPRGFKDFVDAG